MPIKMYSVIGYGMVVGKRSGQDNENIYLEYPGVLVPNQQMRDGNRHLMAPPIGDLWAGENELLTYFPIKKIHVLLSGSPSPDVLKLYSDYSKQLRESITGIKEATADDLNRLPRDGKGEPIIQ